MCASHVQKLRKKISELVISERDKNGAKLYCECPIVHYGRVNRKLYDMYENYEILKESSFFFAILIILLISNSHYQVIYLSNTIDSAFSVISHLHYEIKFCRKSCFDFYQNMGFPKCLNCGEYCSLKCYVFKGMDPGRDKEFSQIYGCLKCSHLFDNVEYVYFGHKIFFIKDKYIVDDINLHNHRAI